MAILHGIGPTATWVSRRHRPGWRQTAVTQLATAWNSRWFFRTWAEEAVSDLADSVRILETVIHTERVTLHANWAVPHCPGCRRPLRLDDVDRARPTGRCRTRVKR